MTTYVVSVFEKLHWPHSVLARTEKQAVLDMAKDIGDRVRVEEITRNQLSTDENGRRQLGGGLLWGDAGQADIMSAAIQTWPI